VAGSRGVNVLDLPDAGLSPATVGEIMTLVAAGRYAQLELKASELLRSHPRAGFLWKALGVAQRAQGKPALAALHETAKLLPDDPEAHSNLANALFESGQYVAAVACYRRTLALKPDAAETHNNLGNALRGVGQGEAAVLSYRRALALQPEFAEAHSNLGNALRGLRQFDAAEASYRRALELKPEHPEAYNNLGNVLLDLGRPDEAAAAYSRAIEQRPQFAAAHSNLGNALRRLGRLEEAVLCHRRALAFQPQFAGAHSNLADVLRDLGRSDEALASSRRAVEIDAHCAGAHNSLGNALLDLGRLDEAERSYRDALGIDVRLAEAHVNLAMIQRLQHRRADALASCSRALEVVPDSAPSLILMAELRADEGEFAAARELFERAVRAAPECAEARAGIVHLRKMTHEDQDWLVAAEAAVLRTSTPRQEAYLRFALGKYCDDVGDFEQAFRHYRRANELARGHAAKYDRRAWTARIDAIIARAALGPVEVAGGHDSVRPVFVCGMPRSGTSLCEQILASHTDVFGAGELPFWESVAADPAPPSAAHDVQRSATLGAEYLDLLARRSPDALRVVDKMPANYLSLGAIHEALPNARFIHMRRHPIDTCLSIYFQHFKSAHAYGHDLEDLAHHYAEYVRLMQHWRSTLPADRFLEVPYEALVAEPEIWTRRMIDFLDLPWDARCLEPQQTRRPVLTASKWQVRQKISGASVGRWRHYAKFLGPLLALGAE
jgi:tetratricopeptide (TPR) repeat protein